MTGNPCKSKMTEIPVAQILKQDFSLTKYNKCSIKSIMSIYTHFSRDKNQFPRQQRRLSGPSLGLGWLVTALSSLALPEPFTTGQGSWLAGEGWGSKAEQVS